MLGYSILFGIIAIVVSVVVFALVLTGRKRLAHFPALSSVRVLYRDQQASGWSKKSLSAKLGGQTGVVEIVVTDKELWLRCTALYAGIKASYDLIHRVPLANVKKVVQKDKDLEVRLVLENGSTKDVTLQTAQPDTLFELLKQLS